MTTLILSVLWIALVVVLLLFIAYLKASKREPLAPLPEPAANYKQIRPLSDPEQTLYWRLVEALPECVVLPQVSFSRFIKPVTDGKVPLPQYRALQNRIAQKTIDYLVCLKDFTVVAAVELDDASHDKGRDEKRDELLTSAQIPVMRIRVADMPSVEQLRVLFTHSQGIR